MRIKIAMNDNNDTRPYNTIQEARADGWVLFSGAFPTTYMYYYKNFNGNGLSRRYDDLVKGATPEDAKIGSW
jgi:hypothetical protein